MSAGRKQVRVAVVGAGSRGHLYARLARRHGGVVGAVVDPSREARDSLGDEHDVPSENRFADVDDLRRDGGPDVDAAVNASPDREHLSTLTRLVGAGLDVLQDKPVGVDLDEIAAVEQLALRHPGCVIAVCHVLRYTELYERAARIIADGELGDVVTVAHSENIAHWHFAHSYVRGNWRSAAESAPMILAKCCHDLDLISWLIDDRFARVYSVGALRHFRDDMAPSEAPQRCTDGCPVASECAFDAVRFYAGRPLKAVADNPVLARRIADLGTSPYGRCVYRCDNDVPDHQVATFEMVSGRSVVLTISGHAPAESRITRIDGTVGSLEIELAGSTRRLVVRGRGRPEPEPRIVDMSVGEGSDDGHGGGDERTVAEFLDDVRRRSASRSGILEALHAHRAALAAEESRLTMKPVDIPGS